MGINEGMTAVKEALKKVLGDAQQGFLGENAQNCHVILLSDGAASDIGHVDECADILAKYAEKGISVSTIGMKDADRELLDYIAEKTGGRFIYADDVGMLKEAMKQAGQGNEYHRNLLDYREAEGADALFAAMRILFIAILGIVIGLGKAVVCEKFLDTSSVIRSSAAGSVMAGLLTEAGLNWMKLSPVIVRCLLCVLFSFTLLRNDFCGKMYVRAQVKRVGTK